MGTNHKSIVTYINSNQTRGNAYSFDCTPELQHTHCSPLWRTSSKQWLMHDMPTSVRTAFHATARPVSAWKPRYLAAQPTQTRGSEQIHKTFVSTILQEPHPGACHEASGWKVRYSSTLSLTTAIDLGGWSTPRPDRFNHGKDTRYPLYRKLGGHQSWFRWMWSISPPRRFDPQTVQLQRVAIQTVLTLPITPLYQQRICEILRDTTLESSAITIMILTVLFRPVITNDQQVQRCTSAPI